MKHHRLVLLVIAATAWTAVAAFACPPEKGASAANAKGSCSAHGANATAAAACPASASCPAGSAQCKSAGTSASAAAMTGAGTTSQCSAAMSAQCTAAMRAQCAKGTRMSTAAASMDCCAGKGASASAAAANGCADRGARSAAAKGAVGCGAAGAMAGMGHCDTKGAAMHGDCSVCSDEATCSNDLRGAGVRSQVVALRNGAMIVYTAESAVSVRALQTTVARYNEHIMNAYTGGDDATLCGGCKSFRGAMASGKFSRELVNVKNGCQILLTSTDRNIVRKIHDSMNTQVAARIRT